MKKKTLIGGVALMLLVGTAGAAEDFTIMKGIHADALMPSEMAGTVGGKLSNKQKQALQLASQAHAQAAAQANAKVKKLDKAIAITQAIKRAADVGVFGVSYVIENTNPALAPTAKAIGSAYALTTYLITKNY